MGVEPRRPSQALALAAAVAVHAAFLAALVWRLGATPVYPPTPVINVELTPLRLDRPERPRAPPPSRPERSLPRLHIPPPSPLPPPLSPVAPAPGPDGQELGMQRTLRGALGCRP